MSHNADTSSQSRQPPAVAVALTYDRERAPYVAAKGRGDLAEAICRLAAEHEILIHEDPDLVESLARLDLGEEIPEKLYLAIAEVIAFAYSLKGKDTSGKSE